VNIFRTKRPYQDLCKQE